MNNNINMGYKDEYYIGEQVTVWKYAKEKENEYNNKIEIEQCIIIGKRINEYGFLEYLVPAYSGYEINLKWLDNYMITPYKNNE